MERWLGVLPVHCLLRVLGFVCVLFINTFRSISDIHPFFQASCCCARCAWQLLHAAACAPAACLATPYWHACPAALPLLVLHLRLWQDNFWLNVAARLQASVGYWNRLASVEPELHTEAEALPWTAEAAGGAAGAAGVKSVSDTGVAAASKGGAAALELQPALRSAYRDEELSAGLSAALATAEPGGWRGWELRGAGQ